MAESGAINPNREEIFNRLKGILMNLLKVMKEKKPENRPQLNWETDLAEDLGVDSLESLDLMNAIEDDFQISPNLSEVSTKRKLSDIVDYIIHLQKQRGIKR
ncbi:MAG: hypothetical protein A3G33_08550 [Omnitrophica bacterium RIFCSPLOWO2_12_FULL_44_17]|uniref:Carrier domain-containing protein n=1 Tax=Candidatus Danuiimicrobium aquiferis TaxID=1801832 RepID=A0A1G1KW57_9BACT|nr:MAG: hypothetical protein A3B72_03770 [Omnitrophica bacterium RIFCSPHIGHO2_02_FULL_45_28]OGW90297.1 MAG: hypothetical protein A3E74_01245 [Omnitrophica bacterium RIFCSPHIGHO2_12_FULL_44_12]OGW97214.1 MAG: hypothetical protein A3G33_08550 [Omnitrophica bacterium RIFCSPLOWO2_12_FULL_44_17]OGX02270.1 MAG: hypothetical protein A3J12_08340 [Omnitrophica bacterium RIFCSPLOWO2_02_FULL_44_11]